MNKPPLANGANNVTKKKIKKHSESADLSRSMKFNMFNNATTLIKPEFDASEKQVLSKNDFITGHNKLKLMMVAEQYFEFEQFKPKHHGKMSSTQNLKSLPKSLKPLSKSPEPLVQPPPLPSTTPNPSIPSALSSKIKSILSQKALSLAKSQPSLNSKIKEKLKKTIHRNKHLGRLHQYKQGIFYEIYLDS